MSKRGVIILVLVVLFGVYFFVVGYEFMERENVIFQKRVKAAREEQQRCAVRNSKYRNYDQFRTSIRLPYTSDLPVDRWMHQYDTLRAGMSEPEVEIILGAPDYARCEVSKQGDKFVGSTWVYAVAIPKDVASDSENSVLQIVFGPDGKLTDKNAMNMQPKQSPPPSAVTTPTASVPASAATPPLDTTPSPTATQQPTPSAIATPVIAPSATATPSPMPQ